MRNSARAFALSFRKLWLTGNRKPSSYRIKREEYSRTLLTGNPTVNSALDGGGGGLFHLEALAHFSEIPLARPGCLCWLHHQAGLLFRSNMTIAHSVSYLYPASSGEKRMCCPSLPRKCPENHLDCSRSSDMPIPEPETVARRRENTVSSND